MSSEKTISNARNAVKKALAYASAAAIILTTFDANQAKAQTNNFKNTNTEITETGYGNLFIKDENDQGVEGATITWTPINVPGDSIPNPYTFTSNEYGISSYEVLVFHDNDVSIRNDYDIEVIQARPNPSTDFTFNFISNKRPNSPLNIISMDGKVVGKYDDSDYNNNVAVYHVVLTGKANGAYFASTIIDGTPQTSKIIKINDSYSGNLGSSAKSVSGNPKDVQTNEAVYNITIEAEGYFDLTDQRTVTEGDQGTDFYNLISDAPPPIDNIDLEGHVWKLDNTSSALENAQVHVRVIGSAQEFTTTSDENGYFRIDNVPLDETIRFSVGGLSDRYSFTGIEYTTPSEIIDSDSVNSNFSAALPLKISSSSAAHIDNMTASGTNQDTILFYQGNSVPEVMKENNRTYFANLQSEENNVYFFEESFTPLENTGINIEYGTYNTNPSEETIQTPLGETLYPVMYANITMGTSAGYYPFVHEIKRALGYKQVAWNNVDSVMETPVQDYTLEDKEIAELVARPYEKALYEEGKTWISLNNISEDMGFKSPNTNVSKN